MSKKYAVGAEYSSLCQLFWLVSYISLLLSALEWVVINQSVQLNLKNLKTYSFPNDREFGLKV